MNPIEDALYRAKVESYQWREPVLVVLDTLRRALVLFVRPHADYAASEPQRYWPVATAYPDGIVEMA